MFWTRLRTHLTYANVMATIAVFIALGGSSYAALRITSRNVPNNALTGADIKNLTGKDVRNNSLTGADVTKLTSADVANGRLLAEDFAPGQLPRGDRGVPGATGAPGSALAYARVSADGTLDAANSKNVTVVLDDDDGLYCLNVTAAQPPRNVVASIEFTSTSTADVVAATLDPAIVASACALAPTAANAFVRTRDNQTVGPQGAPKPFYIVFN